MYFIAFKINRCNLVLNVGIRKRSIIGSIVGNLYFVLAGCLLVLLGIAHSWLGERALLIPLLKRSDLPKLFGDEFYTRRILRLAWHLTSLAWIAMGAVFIFLSPSRPDSSARVFERPGCGPKLFSRVSVEHVFFYLGSSRTASLLANLSRHLGPLVASCPLNRRWRLIPVSFGCAMLVDAAGRAAAKDTIELGSRVL
jgi:hypothetical protein